MSFFRTSLPDLEVFMANGLVFIVLRCSSNRLDWIFWIMEKNSSSGGTVTDLRTIGLAGGFKLSLLVIFWLLFELFTFVWWLFSLKTLDFVLFMLIVVLWSSSRVLCDFIIKLKNSSFGVKSSLRFSAFNLFELEWRIEQRWSSNRFDWIRDKTSKNDESSSLSSILLVFFFPLRSLFEREAFLYSLRFSWLSLKRTAWALFSVLVCFWIAWCTRSTPVWV